MGYNNGRITVSKKQCICSKCMQVIQKGESVWIEPGKLVIHAKCHKNDKPQ